MVIDLRPSPGREDDIRCPGRTSRLGPRARRARSPGIEPEDPAAPQAIAATNEQAAMARALSRLLELTRRAFRIPIED
jgi:hypothetical protein